MWQRRGQVTLRHVHAARGNRARCGAMGVALASGVNAMLTRLPISHLRHLRPHVSLYCFRPKSAHNFLFSARGVGAGPACFVVSPSQGSDSPDETAQLPVSTRSLRLETCPCRVRLVPQSRRLRGLCFPRVQPPRGASTPSPHNVAGRRGPWREHAPPPRPPGTRHRPRLFWLLRVPRALWTGTSRSSAAKLQAEGRRCSQGSLPGASSAGGLLTWSRGRRSRAPVGAEDKPAARAL